MLIPVELNPIGLTKTLSYSWLYLILTELEFPIPVVTFGETLRVTMSPICRPCDVETETVDLIFSTFPVTWVRLLVM